MVQPESPGKARCALQRCLALEAFRLTQAANARHNLSFACKCLHMGGFTCARFLQLQRFIACRQDSDHQLLGAGPAARTLTLPAGNCIATCWRSASWLCVRRLGCAGYHVLAALDADGVSRASSFRQPFSQWPSKVHLLTSPCSQQLLLLPSWLLASRLQKVRC